MRGENSAQWKGGITPENIKIRKTPAMYEWRDKCLQRDNWICQKYLTRGGNLQVHHIENFSDKIEKRTEIDNGITLSKKAHLLFHSIYGKRNNTLAQLTEFINNKNI